MKLKNFIDKARNFVKRSRGYKLFITSSTKRRRGGARTIRRNAYIRPLKKVSKIKKASSYLYKHKGKLLSLAALGLLINRGSKVDIDNMLPVNQNDMQYGFPNFDDVFEPY